MITSAPSTGVASSSPPTSISLLATGASTTPPSETPVDEMLIASARFRTNQRVMIALTAIELDIPNATANTKYTTYSCHSSSTSPMNAALTPLISVPTTINVVGPFRSTYGPTMAEVSPETQK